MTKLFGKNTSQFHGLTLFFMKNMWYSNQQQSGNILRCLCVELPMWFPGLVYTYGMQVHAIDTCPPVIKAKFSRYEKRS